MKIITAATVLALSVALAAPAHADEQSFLDAVHKLGYAQSDQELLRDGHVSCALREQTGDNDTVGKALGAALRLLGHGTTDVQAEDFVDVAVSELCPAVAVGP